ncbi:type I-U CRISPR-associated protein Cas5/Cas6 [Actinomyces naeslundii]|uniref:type I-G CRISPR-associated protein Csb2 n=1 Tax=Actinomyces naeslundii TaxID=1655 RepID=UPI00096E9138|nr:type I-U CRISPR-associated protein Csb2 [Actinomyces naeslundii]OMG29451.1 type I-U CRISPR-associated protein Cas5/Cas6 [Actinomyces naeslundii]
MAPVSITAHFPLGVYHGHAADGSPDPIPSPARLFSAFVSASHTGVTAGADGQVAPDIDKALTWLEENPPNGLHVPSMAPVQSGNRIAYRKTGTIEKDQPKTAAKAISDGYAINGEIGWLWDNMPDGVRDALSRLCEDVPCLGEMDSPVVMSTETVEANWRLDPAATAFTPGGLRVQVPTPGRTRVLRELHSHSRPPKAPTASADRFRPSGDSVRAFPTSEECLRTARYAAVEPLRHDDGDHSPWRDVLIFLADDGTGREFTSERRVSWCVAFHRALVARIGDGAPAVVTGRYLEGRPRPANRLAIQYVPAPVLAQSTVEAALDVPGAFLVMLPSDVSDDDEAVVLRAVAGMTRLNHRRDEAPARLRPVGEVFDAKDFWRPPARGTQRLWSPTPVAVPEVTRQRGEWTFEDAILLSLGFVWRDRFDAVPKGTQGYRSLVARVRERGAGVMWHHRVTRNPSFYAHKMPHGMTAQPYTALISAGDLLADTGVAAVGQSRHLGGGLLVPVDLPAELAQSVVRGRP